MGATLKDALPSPLAATWHAAEQSTVQLRPDHARALSYLIDTAEVFCQLGASMALCALTRLTPEVSDKDRRELSEFFSRPLNIGHWLSAWKLASRLLLEKALTGRTRNPGVLAAEFVLTESPAAEAILSALDQLPNFRNRQRGHTYTLPQDAAKAAYISHRPTIEAILTRATFLTSGTRLCLAMDKIDEMVELRLLCGNVTTDQAAPALVSIRGASVQVGDVLCLLAEDLETTHTDAARIQGLTPMLRSRDKKLLLFQGVRGKTATFMSVDAEAIEAPAAEVVSPFSTILNASRSGQKTKPARMPQWAENLRCYEHLWPGSLEGRLPRAQSFFKGSMLSWADLAGDLDVRRTLVCRGLTVSPAEFDHTHLCSLIERGRSLEIPIVLFTGPGGAGKSTQLLRTAFELYRRSEGDALVLLHRLGQPLEAAELLVAAQQGAQGRVLCVFVDEAGPLGKQIGDIRKTLQHQQVPAIIFCAERPNLWKDIPSEIYDLPDLTAKEADELLSRLQDAKMLGVLEGLDRSVQLERLREQYDRNLLVTLRQVTEGRRFDEIIEDEYRRLTGDVPRQIYLWTCLLHRSGLFMPQEVAWRLAGVQSERDFRQHVLKPCDGLLRHEGGSPNRVYRARHRVIAQVLCSRVLADHEQALEELSDLVGHLVPTGEPSAATARLAQQLLGAPESADALKRGDAGVFFAPLKHLGSRLPEFTNWVLTAGNWGAGVTAFAEGLVRQGVHASAQLGPEITGKLIAKRRQAKRRSELVSLCRDALLASTAIGHGTTQLIVTLLEECLRGSAFAEAVQHSEDYVARCPVDQLPVRVLLLQASAYGGMGDREKECRSLEQAVAVARGRTGQLDDLLRSEFVTSSSALAMAHANNGARQQAVDCLRRSVTECLSCGQASGVGYLYKQLAEQLSAMGDDVGAMRAASDGAEVVKQVDAGYMLGPLLSFVIDGLQRQGRAADAEANLRESIDDLIAEKRPYYIEKFYSKLVSMLEGGGRVSEALEAASVGVERVREAAAVARQMPPDRIPRFARGKTADYFDLAHLHTKAYRIAKLHRPALVGQLLESALRDVRGQGRIFFLSERLDFLMRENAPHESVRAIAVEGLDLAKQRYDAPSIAKFATFLMRSLKTAGLAMEALRVGQSSFEACLKSRDRGRGGAVSLAAELLELHLEDGAGGELRNILIQAVAAFKDTEDVTSMKTLLAAACERLLRASSDTEILWLVDQCLPTLLEHGSVFDASGAYRWRVEALGRRSLSEAEGAAREVMGKFKRDELGAEAVWFTVPIIEARLAAGDHDAAIELAQDSLDLLRGLEDYRRLDVLHAALLAGLEAAGRSADLSSHAMAAVDELLRVRKGAGAGSVVSRSHAGLVRAGRHDEAARLLEWAKARLSEREWRAATTSTSASPVDLSDPQAPAT